MSEDFLAKVYPSIRAAGGHEGEPLVMRALNSRLVAVLTLEDGGGSRPVTWAEAQARGLGEEELFARAIANVERLEIPLTFYPLAGDAGYVHPDWDEELGVSSGVLTGLLLSPRAQAMLREQLGEIFRVRIPGHDFFVAFSADIPLSDAQELEEYCAEIFAATPLPVSGAVFTWERGELIAPED